MMNLDLFGPKTLSRRYGRIRRMGQVSRYLRKTESGYTHWCPACKEMHPLPNGWNFNGNVDRPTFTPSFKHDGLKTMKDSNGQWTGEWEYAANGDPIREVCHYILTDGILNFCSDCTHSMAGKSEPIPALPEYYRDSND